MKGPGIALILLGLALTAGALLYQPTVSTGGDYGAPSEVYNVGAMQYQQLVFLGGATLLIAGVILFAIGSLIEGLERAGTAKPAEVQSNAAPVETKAPGKPCDWCGRSLEWPYRTCTSYDDKMLRKLVPQVQDELCQQKLREHGITAAPDGSSAT